MNHYLVLGIDEDADRDTIRSAFRGLVRRYHPDAGEGSSSTEFRRVVEAYETLSDPERRLVYDRALQRSRRPPRGVEPLGNRVTVEPVVSMSSPSYGHRRADEFVRRQVALDELLDAWFRSLEITSWSASNAVRCDRFVDLSIRLSVACRRVCF
jgi:curved DNA-binding protein CbpA